MRKCILGVKHRHFEQTAGLAKAEFFRVIAEIFSMNLCPTKPPVVINIHFGTPCVAESSVSPAALIRVMSSWETEL
jgi:hypothetical protein